MINQTMILPKNFAPTTNEEMMYLDGGASWSKEFTKGIYIYKVTIQDIRKSFASALFAAAGFAATVSGILGVASSVISGNAVGAIASAAITAGGVAAAAYNVSELKKQITITKSLVHYGGGGGGAW